MEGIDRLESIIRGKLRQSYVAHLAEAPISRVTKEINSSHSPPVGFNRQATIEP